MAQKLAYFHTPGACSLAGHIVLEELGLPFEPVRVDLAAGEQRKPEYLKMNPLGRVPVLVAGDTPITENVAILPYLATLDRSRKLLPFGDDLAIARCMSLLGYLAASVHVAWAHHARPGRYAKDEAAHASMRETGVESFRTYLGQLNRRLEGRDWFAEHYTICDPYLFVFYSWAPRIGIDMAREHPAYHALAQRVLARPATQRAIAREGLTIA